MHHGCQNGWYFLELSPSTSNLSSSCLIHISSCTHVCHPNSRTWVHILAAHWVQSLATILSGQGPPPNITCSGNQLPWDNTTSFMNPLDNTHKIELRATSFLQTPHGCFPKSSLRTLLTRHCMTFVLPAFTLRPFASSHFSTSSTFLATISLILPSNQNHLHKSIP